MIISLRINAWFGSILKFLKHQRLTSKQTHKEETNQFVSDRLVFDADTAVLDIQKKEPKALSIFLPNSPGSIKLLKTWPIHT